MFVKEFWNHAKLVLKYTIVFEIYFKTKKLFQNYENELFLMLYKICKTKVLGVLGGKEVFYLTTHSTHLIKVYGVRRMVKVHSDSKGSFICIIPHTG